MTGRTARAWPRGWPAALFVFILASAWPAAAQDAERLAMARLRLTTDPALTRGCAGGRGERRLRQGPASQDRARRRQHRAVDIRHRGYVANLRRGLSLSDFRDGAACFWRCAVRGPAAASGLAARCWSAAGWSTAGWSAAASTARGSAATPPVRRPLCRRASSVDEEGSRAWESADGDCLTTDRFLLQRQGMQHVDRVSDIEPLPLPTRRRGPRVHDNPRRIVVRFDGADGVSRSLRRAGHVRYDTTVRTAEAKLAIGLSIDLIALLVNSAVMAATEQHEV
jgi:hypothetical protein